MPTNGDRVSRVRAGGRVVTVSKTPAERVAAFRRVVAEASHAKIDGVSVDLFSASAVVAVYDGLNDANREKFAALPVAKMVAVAFRMIK